MGWGQWALLSGGFISPPWHGHGVSIPNCCCNMGRLGQTVHWHEQNPCFFPQLWTPFMGTFEWLGGTQEAQNRMSYSDGSNFQWIAYPAVITSTSSWATLGIIASKSNTPWHHKVVSLPTGCTYFQFFHFPCHGLQPLVPPWGSWHLERASLYPSLERYATCLSFLVVIANQALADSSSSLVHNFGRPEPRLL